MLNIFYGDMPEAIYNPVVFFKNTYNLISIYFYKIKYAKLNNLLSPMGKVD